MGPDATPPESKAIPMNKLGTYRVRIMEIKYPGSKKCHRDRAGTKILTIDKDTAKATPIERVVKTTFLDKWPEVTSSTP